MRLTVYRDCTYFGFDRQYGGAENIAIVKFPAEPVLIFGLDDLETVDDFQKYIDALSCGRLCSIQYYTKAVPYKPLATKTDLALGVLSLMILWIMLELYKAHIIASIF